MTICQQMLKIWCINLFHFLQCCKKNLVLLQYILFVFQFGRLKLARGVIYLYKISVCQLKIKGKQVFVYNWQIRKIELFASKCKSLLSSPNLCTTFLSWSSKTFNTFSFLFSSEQFSWNNAPNFLLPFNKVENETLLKLCSIHYKVETLFYVALKEQE